jgi:hypothetical protein
MSPAENSSADCCSGGSLTGSRSRIGHASASQRAQLLWRRESGSARGKRRFATFAGVSNLLEIDQGSAVWASTLRYARLRITEAA